jgi:hypothetical protein
MKNVRGKGIPFPRTEGNKDAPVMFPTQIAIRRI